MIDREYILEHFFFFLYNNVKDAIQNILNDKFSSEHFFFIFVRTRWRTIFNSNRAISGTII